MSGAVWPSVTLVTKSYEKSDGSQLTKKCGCKYALFHDFCVAPFITLTFPQYPVVKDIDTIDPGDNGDNSDDDSDEDDDQASSLVI